MNDFKPTLELQTVLDEVRHHLSKAQELMDSINPDSVFSARVQHLLDELHEDTVRDLTRSPQDDRPY